MPSPNGPAPSEYAQSLANFGCENCREQHLKCDRVTPTCGRCLAARRECRRAGLKIRVVKKDFKKKQKWVKTPRRAVFVDETKKVISGLGSQDDDLDDNDSVSDSPVPSTDATPAAPSETYTPEMTMTALAAATSIVSPGPAQNGSPTDRASHRPDLHWIRKPELRRIMESIYLTKLMYPLTDITTANLLRHYIQSLAKWLDLCDKDRWFETIVPKIAGTNKVLMHAIFALASRHMHHIGNDIDALSSERYYDSCSELLRSALIYNETVSDSNLFAATIILRVWEEMGGKLHIQQGLTLEHRLTTVAVAVTHHGEDCEGYILTIHHFVKMGGQHLAPRTLGAAAFWVGLRQEIFVAVIKKEPIRILLVPSLVNPVLPLEDRQRSHIGQLEIYGEEDEADDYTLANRAVVHCAEVLNHCFSKTDVPGSQWHKLKDKIDKWKTHLPDTYRPIFCGRDANEPFSEEWYSQSCHVIGWQHHLLAELFLVRKDPSLPPQMALKERIQGLVRRIVGIGLGNQWTAPGMFTACMAIAAFGDWFQDYRDQSKMFEILEMTERQYARPTRRVRDQMVRAWGWQTGPAASHQVTMTDATDYRDGVGRDDMA